MTVQDLEQSLSLTCLVSGDKSRTVTGGYCGDLLSWVMGRAVSGSAWMTVMGNVNAIAVCVLAELPCLILCEDAVLDEPARARAEEEAISVFRTDKTAYETAVALSGLL